MLPSKGYFKSLCCPFHYDGVCKRPYCHFRHFRKDGQGYPESSMAHTNGTFKPLVSAGLVDEPNFFTENTACDESAMQPRNEKQRSSENSLQSTSAGAIIKPSTSVLSYKPTPISELRKRHIPVTFNPDTEKIRSKTHVRKKKKFEYIPKSINGNAPVADYKPTPSNFSSESKLLNVYTPSSISDSDELTRSQVEKMDLIIKNPNLMPSEIAAESKLVKSYTPSTYSSDLSDEFTKSQSDELDLIVKNPHLTPMSLGITSKSMRREIPDDFDIDGIAKEIDMLGKILAADGMEFECDALESDCDMKCEQLGESDEAYRDDEISTSMPDDVQHSDMEDDYYLEKQMVGPSKTDNLESNSNSTKAAGKLEKNHKRYDKNHESSNSKISSSDSKIVKSSKHSGSLKHKSDKHADSQKKGILNSGEKKQTESEGKVENKVEVVDKKTESSHHSKHRTSSSKSSDRSHKTSSHSSSNKHESRSSKSSERSHKTSSHSSSNKHNKPSSHKDDKSDNHSRKDESIKDEKSEKSSRSGSKKDESTKSDKHSHSHSRKDESSKEEKSEKSSRSGSRKDESSKDEKSEKSSRISSRKDESSKDKTAEKLSRSNSTKEESSKDKTAEKLSRSNSTKEESSKDEKSEKRSRSDSNSEKSHKKASKYENSEKRSHSDSNSEKPHKKDSKDGKTVKHSHSDAINQSNKKNSQKSRSDKCLNNINESVVENEETSHHRKRKISSDSKHRSSSKHSKKSKHDSKEHHGKGTSKSEHSRHRPTHSSKRDSKKDDSDHSSDVEEIVKPLVTILIDTSEESSDISRASSPVPESFHNTVDNQDVPEDEPESVTEPESEYESSYIEPPQVKSKTRVAHNTDIDVNRSFCDKPKNKKYSTSEASYQAIDRYRQAAVEPAEVANSSLSMIIPPPQVGQKVRIAHVPNVQSLLSTRTTLLPSATQNSSGSRQATDDSTLKPKESLLIVANVKNCSIPFAKRQAYLSKIHDLYGQIYTSEVAKIKAVNAEKDLSTQCKTPIAYVNKVAQLCISLKKEMAMLTGGAPPVELPEEEDPLIPQYTHGKPLYDCFLQYKLEDLYEQGIPVEHPTEPFAAKMKILYNDKLRSFGKSTNTCINCGKNFSVDENNFSIERKCSYHLERRQRHRTVGSRYREAYWNCCNQSKPCVVSEYHIRDNVNYDLMPGFVKTPPCPSHETFPGIYALDCEMCYTTEDSELTRVTVINHEREVVYESYCKPLNPILDYCTRFSGVEEKHLENVKTSLKDIQRDLLKMFNEKTVLVGHSLGSDLKALKIIHTCIVDTSVVFAHKHGGDFKRKLRDIAQEFLKRTIQEGVSGHCSQEDALAALDLMIYKIKEDRKAFKPRTIISLKTPKK